MWSYIYFTEGDKLTLASDQDYPDLGIALFVDSVWELPYNYDGTTSR